MNDAQAISRANIERFDKIASGWEDNPRRIALSRGIGRAILDAVPLAGTERALEIGCGTGLVTAILAPSLGRVLAVDSSGGMLSVLRGKLRDAGIQNVEVLEADLSQEMPEGPFDFVFSSMTLHHIVDVAELFARVYERLAHSGRVAFADLAREDGSFHANDAQGVIHHGFEPEQLRRWLEAAGFVDTQVRTAFVTRKTRDDGSTREYPILLATAQR